MSGVVLGIVGAVAVVAAVWILGSAVVPGRGGAERLAAGIGCCLFAGWVAMFQPLMRFSLLEHRTLLAVFTIVLLAGAAVRAGPALRPARFYWPAVLAASAPALMAFMPLALVNASTGPGPDMRWHEGWIRQLGGGMLAPAGPYAGIPNGYPWLYHSISSWLELLPGGMAALFWAQEALLFAAFSSGVWLLARELGLAEAESAFAVLLSECAAGLGWVWVHHGEARFVAHAPTLHSLHGDFIVSTALVPSLAMLPPVFPRDLSLAMGPLAIWALLRGLRLSAPGMVALSGSLVGALLLTGPVSALVILATALVLIALDGRRLRMGATFFGCVLVVVLVWAGPFLVHDLLLGGVAGGPVEPDVSGPQALTGVGLLLALGIAGISLVTRERRGIDRRSLLILIAVPLCLAWFAVSMRSVGSIGPLGRPQRYIPSVALALTFPAAIALAALAGAARRVAVVAVPLIVACCACSYVLAAVGLVSVSRGYARGSLFDCNSAPGITVGDHVAIINASSLRLPGHAATPRLRNTIDDDIFRNTGAFVVLRDPPAQLRYQNALRHTASQQERAVWVRDLQMGKAIPGIEWILSPTDATLSNARLAGTCRAGTPFGAIPLKLYHVSQG